MAKHDKITLRDFQARSPAITHYIRYSSQYNLQRTFFLPVILNMAEDQADCKCYQSSLSSYCSLLVFGSKWPFSSLLFAGQDRTQEAHYFYFFIITIWNWHELGSSDSNEAVHIHLLRPGTHGPKTLTKFSPKFTYPIFGDEEQIFGYKGLKIHLRYNACDMRPNLQLEYEKRFRAIGDTEPTDIKAILADFLPKSMLVLLCLGEADSIFRCFR